ncbi:MAG TPA: hypothetical protein PKO09_15800 [Anaerolineae bacterium]|nr:hypothetical protein [Anaerolineae bacterium]
MRDEPDGYQAYLLRLWRVWYQGRWQWRASVDSPGTGERRSFASLAAFVTFLNDTTRQQTPPGAADRLDAPRGPGPLEEEETRDD